MLWAGIDTHLMVHEVEIQNENGKKMWSGKIGNSREGFQQLLEKMRTVERSNSQTVAGVFMNPTGNYHMPVKHFMESNGYKVYVVDARRTEHLRMVQNLGREKSDPADASILVSCGHDRLPESGLTRLLEQLKSSTTAISNLIASDLAAVFPEYTRIFEIDSKVSLRILEKYATPDNIRNADEMELYGLMDTGKGHYDIPDPGQVYAYRIRMNAAKLREDKARIREVEREITARMSENADVRHISAIHGISMTSAAAMVAEIGDIRQFRSAVKLQSYGGKSPDITGSAGKSYATGSSKIRNSHLSNSAYECAVSLVLHKNPEFITIYQREIEKRKKPTQAYIVVGKRLLYHVFSIMKNRKPYVERIPKGRGGDSVGTVA